MRTCRVCKSRKPDTEFYKANKSGKLRSDCKACKDKAEKKRVTKRRQEFYEWKRTLCCERCGYLDYRALQFHHEGDKEATIANMVGKYSLKTIQAEAEKCTVLCANCHQIEHHSDGLFPYR